MTVELTGRFHDYYDFGNGDIDAEELQEGDIFIQPNQDRAGRMAVRGNHANRGYSGYYKGFLYADGGARIFKDWVALWPNGENRYAAQQDKPATLAEISNTIERLAGRTMTKVKGGWALDGDVDDILGRGKVE